MQKGPYFDNVGFISPLPPGYMETATGIGRSYAKAIDSATDSIAGAIEKYKQNKEEREFLDQKFEMASSVIDKFKGNPDLEKDPRVQKLIDGVGKFSSYSNTQKKAFLNNAEFAIAQFDKEEQRAMQQAQLGLAAQKMEMDRAQLASALATAKLQQESAGLNIAQARQDQANQESFTNAMMTTPTTRQETVQAPISGLMDVSRAINGNIGPQIAAMQGAKPFSTNVTTKVPLPAQQPSPGALSAANLAQFSAGVSGGIRPGRPVAAPPELKEVTRDVALPQFNSRAQQVGQSSTSPAQVTVNLTPEEKFASSLQRYVDGGGKLDMKSVKELRDYFGANKDQIDMQPLGAGVMGVTVNGKLKDVVQLKGQDAPKLEQADKTFMMNAAEYRTQLDGLENTIKKYGTSETISPQGSAELNQAGYKLAILYAKIVDPQSVAREGEVEAAKKYIIPLGAAVRDSTALSALNNQRNEILRRVGLFEKINGVKVPGFEQQQQTTKSEPTTRKMPGGRTYQFEQI